MEFRQRALGAIAVVLALAVVPVGALSACSGNDSPSAAKRSPARRSVLAELADWQLSFLHAPKATQQPNLYVADADGSSLKQLSELAGDEQTPNWSPDGRRVAIRWVPRDYDNTPLVVIDEETGAATNLTERTGLRGWSPSWSPDGKQFVTAAQRRGDRLPGLYVMGVDGSRIRRVTSSSREAQYASWSPAGGRIAFTFVVDGGFDIFTVRPDGSDLRRLTSDGAQGQNNWPVWSPDGTQIAWGRGEGVWVMRADGSGKRHVTDLGGAPLAWAPGPFITFGCSAQRGGATLCAIRSDGTGATELLGGIDAGFPGWRPQ